MVFGILAGVVHAWSSSALLICVLIEVKVPNSKLLSISPGLREDCSGILINGQVDHYGVLQVEYLADDSLIKKQYRRLALFTSS
ncbi:hypothetical protein HPP92_015483 [Vanilla planifolia]|uniref:Uncharacterized protein n=1 Tax=Vanilla planifolia TaxID=51239 RepID=A0A835QXV1_VANPL|nr:hypothetical protein HPP92_015483 [Vanilla planifolia]